VRNIRPVARRLDGWLGGPADAGPIRQSQLLACIGLFLLGTLLVLLRLRSSSFTVLWAEDGTVFVRGALADQPWASLLQSYAGYMHAFPRLAAWAAVNSVPLSWVPPALAVISSALCSAIATLAFALLRARMRPVLPRLAIWLAIAVMPIAGIEVMGSIANAHWYLLIGLFVVLITRQRHPALIAAGAVVAVFAAMSDPLSGIFLPLVLVRLVGRTRRRELWIPLLFVGALLVQLAVVLSSPFPSPSARPGLGQLARATAYRVFVVALSGDHATDVYLQFGAACLVIATLLVLGAGVWTLLRGGQLGGLAAASLAASVIFFVVASVIRWHSLYDPAVDPGLGASRYSVVPGALVVIALAAAATASSQRARTRVPRQLAAVVLIAVLLISVVPDFLTTARVPPVAWAQALRQASRECATGQHDARIPITPTGLSFVASCESLERHAIPARR
jgi:hypothetical protein